MLGLRQCNSHDMILISDVNEIVRPSKLSEIYKMLYKAQGDTNKIVICGQTAYRYFFNRLDIHNDPWLGSRAIFYKDLKDALLDFSKKFAQGKDTLTARVVKDAGWRFAHMGSADQEKTKQAIIAHAECPSLENREIKNLMNKINSYPLVKVDSSFPAYIRNNVLRYMMQECIDSVQLVRGCEGWGFYAEFLWVINHLHYAIRHNKVPVIYWGSDFAYYQEPGYNKSTNCWEYYFEPVSNISYEEDDIVIKQHWYDDNNFSALWNYGQYIENLPLLDIIAGNKVVKVTSKSFGKGEKYPVGNDHLYGQEFRTYVKEKIIDRFIHLKKPILDKIEAFYQKYMAGKKTIGIHLRGSFLGNEVPAVPLSEILREANLQADETTQFFIATDQIPLLEEAKKWLNGKVIFFESDRFNNTTSPIAGGQKLDPILGENVIVEMFLLSRCDYFIHTISNVSTTVLYFNPTLKHTVLY